MVTVIQPPLVNLALSVPTESLARGSTFAATVTADPAPPADADLSIVLSLTGVDVMTAIQTADLTATTASLELTFTVPTNAPETLTLATETTADERLVTVTEATTMVTVIQPPLVNLALSVPTESLARDSTFAVTVTAEPAPPADADLSVVLSLTGAGVMTATLTADLTATTASLELTFTVPTNAPAALTLATETTADERLVRVTEADAATVTVIQPVSLVLSVPEVPLPRGLPFAVTVTAAPAPPLSAELNVRVTLTANSVEISTQTATLTATTPSQVLSFPVPMSAPSTLMLTTETTADEGLVTVTEAEAAAVTIIQPLDFVAPEGTVNMDDLLFVLRYIKICANTECTEETVRGLLVNLPPLLVTADSISINILDITNDGEGDAQDIVILMQSLSQIPASSCCSK